MTNYDLIKNMVFQSMTFFHASEQFRLYQKKLVSRGERTARQAKDYEYRIDMLNKFFSKFSISLITIKNIDDYVESRTTLAKVPVSLKTVKLI